MLPLEKGVRLYGGSVRIKSIDESGNLFIKSRLFSLNNLYVYVFVLNNYSSCIGSSILFE